MIKLYGVPASRTGRTLWMLAELGVEYENVPVHYAGEAQTPEFLAINPNGKIPALDDDGTVLFESLAINLYLAEKYGRGVLWPESVEDHGRCYQWSFWAMTEIDGLGTEMILNRTTLAGAERDEQKALAAEERLRKPVGVLNDALRGRHYLLGSEFSVADLNVAAVVFVLGTLGHTNLAPYPELTAWLGRCLKRPARTRAFPGSR